MPKILVADDNANIQKMVVLSFEDRGVEVVAVGNGEAAVRRIPDVNPDLVLADIFMPVRNGYEVCEFVKKDSRFSHVPVILLVGAFDPLDEKEARRVGADGVLKKPFVPPDPLIAMVMSALEKNPKAAAEMAKAREAKQPPPQVHDFHTIPEPATSIRTEPKSLPNFPDPTPEEERLLYTSGTGSRSLEDVSAGKTNAKEAQPPIPEFDQAIEDEFDSSVTSRDWRRSAMDIEIPADANLPAFVTGDELDSSAFPSERDVPPRHVSAEEAIKESAASPIAPQASAPDEPPLIEAPAPSLGASDSDFFAPVDSERFETEKAASRSAVEPETLANSDPAPASDSAPSHWMDQLAQVAPVQPSNDWMSALSEQTGKDPISALSEKQRDDGNSFPAPHLEIQEGKTEAHFDSESFDPQPLMDTQEPAEGPFLVKEPVSSVPNTDWFSPSQKLAETSREADVQGTIEHTAIDSVPVVSSREESLEVASEPEPPVALHDPDLVEPPAVHVTPEPLLVEDEPLESAAYGDNQRQDLEPTHSFFAPPVPAAAEEPSETEDVAGTIEAARALEAAPAETEMNQRVPTGPPPSREALAEIPFLTPPPDFFAHPHEHVPAAPADPQTVDMVVQKVLEKLQPQLQDLLSQGVLKPLVENLLQSELTKKNQ